jgi:hypothetical protein
VNRRTFLRRTAPAPAALALAGCAAPGTGTDDGDDGSDGDGGAGTPSIPMLEDPPDAVYLPGHRKSMRLLEPVSAGDYALAPMLTYPHPFWVVTGTDRQLVEPDGDRGIHLMVIVWDRETGVVLPGDAEPTVTIERDGRRVTARSLWPMLSQEMGVHFGDNVSLPADGTYTATVDLPPLSTRRTGALAGRFADGGTATFEFAYDRAFRERVVAGIELLEPDRWGERGALEPMTGDGVPYSTVPPAGDYPGTRLVEATAGSGADDGLPRSDDAAVVASLLAPGSRLADGDERYLLVSPRTPYNRVPLPNASLRVAVERDGEAIVDAPLEATVDGEYGLHYGRSLADVRTGDRVGIAVQSPPQAARHQGYETAFFEMEPLALTVPSGL